MDSSTVHVSPAGSWSGQAPHARNLAVKPRGDLEIGWLVGFELMGSETTGKYIKLIPFERAIHNHLPGKGRCGRGPEKHLLHTNKNFYSEAYFVPTVYDSRQGSAKFRKYSHAIIVGDPVVEFEPRGAPLGPWGPGTPWPRPW